MPQLPQSGLLKSQFLLQPPLPGEIADDEGPPGRAAGDSHPAVLEGAVDHRGLVPLAVTFGQRRRLDVAARHPHQVTDIPHVPIEGTGCLVVAADRPLLIQKDDGLSQAVGHTGPIQAVLFPGRVFLLLGHHRLHSHGGLFVDEHGDEPFLVEDGLHRLDDPPVLGHGDRPDTHSGDLEPEGAVHRRLVLPLDQHTQDGTLIVGGHGLGLGFADHDSGAVGGCAAVNENVGLLSVGQRGQEGVVGLDVGDLPVGEIGIFLAEHPGRTDHGAPPNCSTR